MRKFEPDILSAYRNLDIKNIPGERWKDVPDFEGYYLVSSYGRIKSLPREVEVYFPRRRHTMTYRTKTKIRKIKIHRRFNSVVNRDYFECTVELKRDGLQKTLLVHRLVYHAFVHAIDFEKDKTMIMHRDGNGLHNHHQNLFPGERSHVLQRSYAKRRHISPFKLKSRREIKKIAGKAAKARQKSVILLSLSGKKIKTFKSIKEAARKLSIPESNIIDVLKDYRKSAGGFKWEYASSNHIGIAKKTLM